MKIMIKKIIGILAVLAILALIVYTALGVGTYKSMLPEDLFTKRAIATSEVIEKPTAPTADVDTPEPVEQITE